jgi:tetratricopeptide (TPR) repeat protein
VTCPGRARLAEVDPQGGIETALCPVTVGREREMRRLTDAIRAVRGGDSRVVVLAGDAGLGKTRLAVDLRQAATELGMATMWGGCSEAELSLPYLPFLEAVGNHLSQADLEAIRSQLTANHRELAWLFPQLELAEPPQDPSDPVQGKLRLFEAVLSLLRICARFPPPLAGSGGPSDPAPQGAGYPGPEGGGLLVVLENMHWADASTRELLEYLVRRLRGTRVMLLLTCRLEGLERRHPLTVMVEHWRRSGHAERVDLGPLSPDRVGEMIRATVGVETVALEVRSLLQERCEGNPFVLEEILKEALDRGAVSRRDLTWRQDSLQRMRLPRTVRDSVLGRIADLPEQVADVLRCASVLGRSFDYALLVAISGRDPQTVQAALRTCVQQQLLEEDPEAEGRYRFRHSLTREAVYDDLLVPQRQELHAAAAEALREQPGTPAVELCQHLLAARREQEAVAPGLEAAEQALHAQGYREAAELYERILPLVTEPRRQAELRCRMGTAFLLNGDTALAELHLEAGVRTLDRLGDARVAAHFRLRLGRCRWERSRPDLAAAEYEAARQVLEALGPSDDLATAYVRFASLASFDLDGMRAIEMASRAVEIATRAGAEEPRIWAYNFLGLGHIQVGQVAEGIEELDRSYREAADHGLNVIAANALYNGILVRVQHFRPREAMERVSALKAMQAGSMAELQALRAEGFVYLWGIGLPERALETYREALALAREGEAWRYVHWLEVQLAAAQLQLDRTEAARRLFPDGSPALEQQDRTIQLWLRMRLGLDTGQLETAALAADEVLAGGDDRPLRVRLFLGDIAVETLVAAGRIADAARLVDATAGAGAPPDHPYLLRMAGRAAYATGRLPDAVAALARSAEFFRAAGCRHEEATSRLCLADAMAAAGQVEAAQAELRSVLASAEERGARREARIAREALVRLGTAAITTEHVKEALESLHHPAELARASLGRLLGLPDDHDGRRLRGLLTEHVDRLASSADGREREAGQLLRDYYLRRVGSQEVVADRLHLTRATFYRRLHLGWSLLGERLTAMG